MNKSQVLLTQLFLASDFEIFFFLIQTSDLSVSQVMTNSEVSSHRLVYIHKMSSLCLLGKSLTSVFCFCLFVCFLPGDRRPCPGSWDLCRSWKTEVQNSGKCLPSPSNYFNTSGRYNVRCVFSGRSGFSKRQFMPSSSGEWWFFVRFS